MSNRYPIEVLLRPPVELWSVFVAGATGLTALFAPWVLMMTFLTLLSAGIIWHKSVDQPPIELTHLINPLELKPALFFGALLVLVILLGKAAVHFFGEAGLSLLATVSGIADVDPINLTLSRMSIVDLSLEAAVLGIVIASSSNTLVKALLAVIIGGIDLGIRVLLPLFVAAVTGLATAWLV